MRTLVVAVALSTGVVAQDAQPAPSAARSPGDVQVYLTAVDASGALVTDLDRQDFEIYDEGRRRPLTSFQSSIQPINVVIMIDASASLELMQEQIRISADRVVAQLGPDDRARIGSFSNKVAIPPQGTGDRVALSRAVSASLSSRAPTLLWDAIDLAIAAVASEPGRRVVLVFTDGDDTGSRHANFDRVIERAQADDVMIYAVGVTRLVLETDPLRMLTFSPDGRLRRLAEATGGGYTELMPKTDQGATFARVADELHRQYLLGFAPDPRDGKMHELRVSATRPGLHVRARQRYRAPLP